MYPFYYHRRNRERHYVAPSFLDIIIPFVGTMTILSVAGGLQLYYREQAKEKANPSYGFNEEDSETKIFEPGEHIISVLIDSPLEEAQQYEYHEGYKPIGIASSTYGKGSSHDAGSCLLYVNESEIEAQSTGIKDGNPYFGEFGTPTYYVQEDLIESDTTIEFAPGQHILSIPVSDPTDFDSQYSFYEGYEPIGIATAAYGKADDNSSGACMLYVNTETVQLEKKEDGTYTNFGIPKEEVKVKIKK